MDVSKEIAEYRQYGQEIRDRLDSQFTMHMFNKEYAEAYKTLGILMEYKLIEPDDSRITPKNTEFKAGGIEAKHRFELDYRKDKSYIPMWMYGTPKYSTKLSINSLTHWGKRVEGNYSGDVIFESRPIEIRISQCRTFMHVRATMELIEKVFKLEASRQFNTGNIEQACKEGVYRVYKVEIMGNVLASERDLGVIILKMGDEGPEATLVLRNHVIVNLWLPLNETIEKFKAAMVEVMPDCRCRLAISADKALEKQKGMISLDKSMGEANRKLREKAEKAQNKGKEGDKNRGIQLREPEKTGN